MWLPYLEELATDEDRPRTVVAIVPHISESWQGARAVVGSVHMDQDGEFEQAEEPAEELTETEELTAAEELTQTEPVIDVIEVREVEEIPSASSISPHPRGHPALPEPLRPLTIRLITRRPATRKLLPRRPLRRSKNDCSACCTR